MNAYARDNAKVSCGEAGLSIFAPPAANFMPWTHVPNQIPLNMGVTQTSAQPIPVASGTVTAQTTPKESHAVKVLRAGWMKKKAEIFAGKYHLPDSEDPDTVN